MTCPWCRGRGTVGYGDTCGCDNGQVSDPAPKDLGWEGADGSTTAIVRVGGRTFLRSNLGEWLELHTMDLYAAEEYATANGLEPMHPDRLRELTGGMRTRDEDAGWSDSQVRS